MSEIWKDVVGYEGFYKVSNLGRVKSLDRVVEYSSGFSRMHKGLILKQCMQRNGYLNVELQKSPLKKRILVHRLIALVFIPNPENKATVNHKNGIKTDNSVANLEWNTVAENNQHAFTSGIKKQPKGLMNRCSKSVIQLSLSGKFMNEFSCQREAMEYTGVSQGGISNACNGKTHTAGGFKWAFEN